MFWYLSLLHVCVVCILCMYITNIVQVSGTIMYMYVILYTKENYFGEDCYSNSIAKINIYDANVQLAFYKCTVVNILVSVHGHKHRVDYKYNAFITHAYSKLQLHTESKMSRMVQILVADHIICILCTCACTFGVCTCNYE